ncbi:LMBR1 domain-containing protein 2 homolog A [Linum perenne]
MWVFYLISLPLTLGMVVSTLRYFAGPEVPRYVLFTVGYTWAMVPLIQGFEDAGDFTVTERLKTSIHANLVFYLIVGSVGLFGLILLILMDKIRTNGVLGFAMACSNTFGLVTGAFLLGFGLSEIPKTIWRYADWTIRQKALSHKIAKMAVKLDDAHQEFSNAIVVAQATSNQMSKRDPLRPYMDVIDNMLVQLFRQDPSFKPQGGRLGENDMDYDTDEKSMATLRRHLRRARDEYYRYKSEYMTFVLEALELEDTIKNYERRQSTGWKYLSSFRPARSGRLGSLLDTIEFLWRCMLRKQLEKLLAVLLGTMSAAILLAEATLVITGVDLSLFSLLIKSVGRREIFVQANQLSQLAYDMLRMGKINDAVPFFGIGFNRIYPLFMVVYTLLVASNFFDRVLGCFGSWKKFSFQTEVDDTDGFDPSGLIILQKERLWLEQGQRVGEHVVPLARNFNGMDVESASNNMDKTTVEMKATSNLITDDGMGSSSRVLKEENRRSNPSREALSSKYAAVREQSRISNLRPLEKNIVSAKVSLLDAGNSDSDNTNRGTSSGLTARWESMKNGFQTFKANIEAKRFLNLRQMQESKLVSHDSSPENLDEIFQRLKRPSVGHGTLSDEDDTGDEIRAPRPTR